MPVHGLLPVNRRFVGTRRKSNHPLRNEIWIRNLITRISRPIDPGSRRMDVTEGRRQKEYFATRRVLDDHASLWVDFLYDTMNLWLSKEHAIFTMQ